MPPVAAAAGIASALGGAIINSRSQGRALKSQEKSAADAMAYQRDLENRRRWEYDQAQTLARQRYDNYNRRRIGLLRGLGMYDGPDPMDSPAPTPYTPTPPSPGNSLAQSAGGVLQPPNSGFQNPGGATAQAPTTLATLTPRLPPGHPLTMPQPVAPPAPLPGVQPASSMTLGNVARRRGSYGL